MDSVDAQAITDVLNQFGGKVPVIAPIGIGVHGEKYNINADWAATQIAVALQAKKLIFLTDQEGILDGEKNLIATANPEVIEEMISSGVIYGGMSTKVRAMTTALESGIHQVRVLHAQISSLALSAQKVGTVLTSMTKVQHGRAS